MYYSDKVVGFVHSVSDGVAAFARFNSAEVLVCIYKFYFISYSYAGQEIVGKGNPSPTYRLLYGAEIWFRRIFSG